MKFSIPESIVFVPDGGDPAAALARTTDMGIGAHQDDIEIMALGPILACYDDPARSFTGVVVSDGAGSPRSGPYADYTDEEMKTVRIEEQKNAARIGGYAAQVFLGYKSSQIKDPAYGATVDDIEKLLSVSRPKTVYTHNFADKHDTHVSVALRVIEAIKRLPESVRPEKIYSMEVWRGLDWLCDGDKTLFDTSAHPNMAAALLGVYDSQITGGKRYDAAAQGRRLANATFFESHGVDTSESFTFGLDITDLINTPDLTPAELIAKYIRRMGNEITDRINKFA